jgi:hypothetical protein
VSIKNANDNIGNRTRELPTCSAANLKCTPNIIAITKSKDDKRRAMCVPSVWENRNAYRTEVGTPEKTIGMK